MAKTYTDLAKYLQQLGQNPECEDILRDKLQTDKYEGRESQEEIFRLLAVLPPGNLFPQLIGCSLCSGNYTGGTITTDKSADIYEFMRKCPKDKGDKSDLTLYNSDTNTLIACTSKNLTNYHIGKLDIRELLCTYYAPDSYSNAGYNLTICIIIPNKSELKSIVAGAEKSNMDLIRIINNQNDIISCIIIDHDDIIAAFHRFYIIYYQTNFDKFNILKSETINYHFHQELAIIKTLQLFSKSKSGCNEILWGHVCRSGKSYIIAGVINRHSIGKTICNYLIITTAPNETINQLLNMFHTYKEFNDFNIYNLYGANIESIKLSNKNIIICSKQFLSGRLQENVISWLSNIQFNIRFVDESHNGGTTELAQNMLITYKAQFTVYITATYYKPLNTFSIPIEAQILWNIDDISLCKRITYDNKDEITNELSEKHGLCASDVLKKYTVENMVTTYSQVPTLNLLTWHLTKELKEEIQSFKDSYDGLSVSAILALNKTGDFKIPDMIRRLIWTLFGKYNAGKLCVTRAGEYKGDCFIDRIHKITESASTNHRWFTKNKPLVVLAFLPCEDQSLPITSLCKTLYNFLVTENLLPTYEIVYTTGEATNMNGNNFKERITNATIKAKYNGKTGVLVLTGKQGSLGVSLNNCDVVLLLNNVQSVDTIYQQMFRSMTESTNKQFGFVVDLNFQRVVTTTTTIAQQCKPELSTKDALKYTFEHNLIQLNKDEWLDVCGDVVRRNTENVMTSVYNAWSYTYTEQLNNKKITTKLLSIFDIMSNYALSQLGQLFYEGFDTMVPKQHIPELSNPDSDISSGIQKLLDELDNEEVIESDDEPYDELEDNELLMDYDMQVKLKILDNIVRLMMTCILLTIREDNISNFGNMCERLLTDKYKTIISDRLTFMCCKNTLNHILSHIVNIYSNHLMSHSQFNKQFKHLREVIKHDLHDRTKLAQHIETYLIPSNNEKKENAEISTPIALRKNMLDTIPKEFWKQPRKVFEPCSGKGGFLNDILDRFMDGLKTMYPNKTKRYEVIVEECIYFSDINALNIYIGKLLLDPENKYKLNYHEGDTLKLDITKKWGIENFDAVIGNPPYETDPSLPGNKPIYNLFIQALIDKCNYLLFVVPSRWFVGGKGLDKFRIFMLKRKDIKIITHVDKSSDWFGNTIEIKGGVNYFLKDSGYAGLCKFNNINCNLSKYSILLHPKYQSILNRINNTQQLISLYKGRFFGIETNDKRLQSNGNVKCYVSVKKNTNRIMYLPTYNFTPSNTSWKVITTEAAHGAYSGFGEIFIGKPDEVHTGSYISFAVESEDEAKSLVSYMKCKLPNYMLGIAKISQHVNKKACQFIPLVPLDRDWSNELVYQYFRISEDELI